MTTSNSFSIPCSTSNLGPGFDCFGLALSLSMHIHIQKLDSLPQPVSPNQLRTAIQFQFNGFQAEKLQNYASMGKNLILDMIIRVLEEERVNKVQHSFLIRVKNEIPIGSGLGSSGVAVIAGIICARFVGGLPEWSKTEILEKALHIEGHPDNVTPSILGGFVSAVTVPPTDTSYGPGKMYQFPHEFDKRIKMLVVTPNINVSTQEARSILPQKIPLHTAVFNMQRAVALPSIFSPTFRKFHPAIEKRQEIFQEVLKDVWHQSHRGSLMPGVVDALNLRMPGLLGSILSGAGPTVLSFVESESEEELVKIQKMVERSFIQCGLEIVKSCYVEFNSEGLMEGDEI